RYRARRPHPSQPLPDGRRSRRVMRIGAAMVAISMAPSATLLTMPGTLIRLRPKVASPSTKTAMTTPGMVPLPPAIETPPSTTMVTISSSQPSAILGRVEAARAGGRTPATPHAHPRESPPERNMGAGGPDAAGEQPAGKAARQPRQHEQQETDALDPDAG